jgi:hypothetical protein
VVRRHRFERHGFAMHQVEREFDGLVAVTAHAAQGRLHARDDLEVEALDRHLLIVRHQHGAALLEQLQPAADDGVRFADRAVNDEIDTRGCEAPDRLDHRFLVDHHGVVRAELLRDREPVRVLFQAGSDDLGRARDLRGDDAR